MREGGDLGRSGHAGKQLALRGIALATPVRLQHGQRLLDGRLEVVALRQLRRSYEGSPALAHVVDEGLQA